MLDLEFALRGVARATKSGEYAISMAKRAKRALAFLRKIDETVNDQELSGIISTASGVKLKLNNESRLTVAADAVANSAKRFASNNDGSALAGVDHLLPSEDKYKGRVYHK